MLYCAHLMKNRSTQLFLFTGGALLMLLVIVSTGLMVSPLQQLESFARNPLRFKTRTRISGPVVLEQVQKLNRLETTRYNGQAIVRGDTSGILPGWLAGDKMVFIAHGEVVAGVDLSKLKAEDVREENGHITLKLPRAEIFNTSLNNDTSEVFERKVGLLSKPDAALETKVRQEAEARIREAAIEAGVLRTAQSNAHDALREFLKTLGVEELEFEE